MNNNVGGGNVPSLGGTTINGGNYSSGWGKSYNFNDSSFNGTVTSLETFSFKSYAHNWQDIDGKRKPLEIKPASPLKILSALANEPIKNLFKDAAGLITNKNASTTAGIVTTIAATALTEVIGTKIEGKSMDWTKIIGKAAGKGSSATVCFLGSLVSIKKVDGKLKWVEKGLDKYVYSLIYNEKGALGDIWSRIGGNDIFKPLNDIGVKPTDNLKPSSVIKLFKDPKARSLFSTARKQMYDELLKDMVKGGAVDALKNIGLQMGVTVGFDYAFSLIGNFVGGLVQGKTVAEALDIENMHYGQEILKSVNKTVWSFAGKFIGYSIGNPKVGQIVGALIGSTINNWICEPFRKPNGDIDEGACAIAAGAELAGAIAGGVLCACLCSGPVGWVIGLGILAGAAVGYLVTVVVYNWDKISEWISDRVAAVVEGMNIAKEAVCVAAVAVADFFVEKWDAAVDAVSDAFTSAREFAERLWQDISATVVEGVTTAAVAVGDFFSDLGDGATWLWDEFCVWLRCVFA